MFHVISNTWALMMGMLFLMVGNGMQGTLLGVRGAIEGFSPFTMSLVTSAYFLGFLGGSRLAPLLIKRVGHVRVFAALASFISAVLILYPAFAHPAAWFIGRVLVGFCFSGVYVTAESWLNNSVDNQNRGKALSLYLIVQMAGIVAAQALLSLGDPSGYILFVFASVLVSISFAPILLSISPTPSFETAKPMTIRALIEASPLACVGMFLMGGVFSAQFGMSSVYGTEAGLSVARISIFVASFYVGAVLLQWPIGWLSDRMDRRVLILGASAIGGLCALIPFMMHIEFNALLGVAFLIGGTSNPLYGLLIAYANDYLEPEDMASASGGLLFINGVGAISGPILTGFVMSQLGADGYFLFLAIVMGVIAVYAGFRMTRRATSLTVEETVAYTPVMPTASPFGIEVAQEVYIEAAAEEEEGPA